MKVKGDSMNELLTEEDDDALKAMGINPKRGTYRKAEKDGYVTTFKWSHGEIYSISGRKKGH